MLERDEVPFLYSSGKKRKFKKVCPGNVRGGCEGVGMTGFPGCRRVMYGLGSEENLRFMKE